jgi:hypothetical protein
MNKIHDIILLPNEKYGKIYMEEDKKLYVDVTLTSYGGVDHFHLYVLSDSKIQEGDWMYAPYSNIILQYNSKYINVGLCKKIIATTDDGIGELVNGFDNSIPGLSEELIKKYIDSYNSGKKIESIMVEYQRCFDCIEGTGGQPQKCSESEDATNCKRCQWDELKLDKSNCIIIKSAKENWNREEVVLLCENSFALGIIAQKNIKELPTPRVAFSKFIKENL